MHVSSKPPLESRPDLGTMILAGPLSFLAVAILSRALHSGLLKGLFLSMLAGFVGSLVSFIVRKEKTIMQAAREEMSVDLVPSLKAGAKRRYYLYLRPFLLDKKLAIPDSARARSPLELNDRQLFFRLPTEWRKSTKFLITLGSAIQKLKLGEIDNLKLGEEPPAMVVQST